MITKRS